MYRQYVYAHSVGASQVYLWAGKNWVYIWAGENCRYELVDGSIHEVRVKEGTRHHSGVNNRLSLRGQTALYQYTSWYFQAESGREIEMESAWSITNSFPNYTFYQECVIKYALDSSSWALPWLTAALPGVACMPLELILPSFPVCRCLLGTVCLTWITLYFTSYWTASLWVGSLTDKLCTDSCVPRPIFLPPAWPGNEVNV